MYRRTCERDILHLLLTNLNGCHRLHNKLSNLFEVILIDHFLMNKILRGQIRIISGIVA